MFLKHVLFILSPSKNISNQFRKNIKSTPITLSETVNINIYLSTFYDKCNEIWYGSMLREKIH